jgi:hypothetical protein
MPPRTSLALRRGGGGRCLAGAERRRHRNETAESEKRDATFDILLKHPDATLTTYVKRQMKNLKHAFDTLAKTHENT